MKNSKAVYREMVNRINIDETGDEITAIAYMVMEKLFSMNRADVLTDKMIPEEWYDEAKMSRIIARINGHEPVQYVLNEADFYGRKFFVDPAVLIPRPETEELVHLVIRKSSGHGTQKKRILDIGTGTGCIAITLSLELNDARVFATDVSTKSLAIAIRNDRFLKSSVEFIEHDILAEPIPFEDLHIVVSNPPYIPQSEMKSMRESVYSFEPSQALFVPDNEPFIFYTALAAKAWDVLTPEGLLAVEINERFGKDVAALFSAQGYEGVEIVRDISNKERIVFGYKPQERSTLTYK